MKETKRLLRLRLECVPIGAYRFQQTEGADDVGLNKIFRPVDGSVDMGLRSEIENGPWLMVSQQARHQGTVTYIALNEQMPGITLQAGEVLQVAGIRQFIQVDYRLIGLGQPVEHEITADEAGSAGYKNSHASDFPENSRSDQAKIAQQCLAVDTAAL